MHAFVLHQALSGSLHFQVHLVQYMPCPNLHTKSDTPFRIDLFSLLNPWYDFRYLYECMTSDPLGHNRCIQDSIRIDSRYNMDYSITRFGHFPSDCILTIQYRYCCRPFCCTRVLQVVENWLTFIAIDASVGVF